MIHVNMDCPDESHMLYDLIKELTSSILASVAVPLFFMFSGLLFFYKLEKFTKDIYKEKLYKRIKTLLIPYIFWNSMFIIYYFTGRILGLGSQYGIGLTFIEHLKPFWNINEAQGGTGDLPISIQFWYIRDLMIMVTISPIVYWFTKKLRYFFILTLGVLWLTDSWFHVTGFSATALTFFSLGAYFSIYKKDFVKWITPHVGLIGCVYLFIVILLLKGEQDCFLISRIGVVIGMAFVVSLVAKFLSNGILTVNNFLSESSFFIFAYHMLALTILEEIFPLNFSFQSDMMFTILYLLWAIIIVLIGLLLYYLLKRYAPKFTAIITGGR